MSDFDDYLSDNDSGSEISSDYEEKNKKPSFKKPVSNLSINKTDLEDDDVEDVDNDGSDIEDNDEEDNDDINLDVDEEEIDDDDEDEDEEDVQDDDADYYDEEEKTTQKGGVKKNTQNKHVTSKKPMSQPLIIDSDDDEYTDENYLQKFDQEINRNYVKENHPESIIHNNDEVKALSEIVRDANNIIIDPLHKTIPFLTKYEKARILGQRAKQIESGAKPFIKVPENIIDGYLIAELELQQKKIPFVIRRPLPSGGCEYWNLRDLEIISF